jgi:hypothetical protein
MRQGNDNQTANLRRIGEEISVVQKGLSELARQVYQMMKEKNTQKDDLTELQTHMEQWGAIEEDTTRQLQI